MLESPVARQREVENADQPNRSLDLRGWACTWCILKAKSWLSRMNPGQVLEILTTDPQVQDDFLPVLKKTGDCLFSVEERNRYFRLLVRRGG